MDNSAHDALLKNARKALKNLSKDNTTSLSNVLNSLNKTKIYLEDLMWEVEEAIDCEYSDFDDQDIRVPKQEEDQ